MLALHNFIVYGKYSSCIVSRIVVMSNSEFPTNDELYSSLNDEEDDGDSTLTPETDKAHAPIHRKNKRKGNNPTKKKHEIVEHGYSSRNNFNKDDNLIFKKLLKDYKNDQKHRRNSVTAEPIDNSVQEHSETPHPNLKGKKECSLNKLKTFFETHNLQRIPTFKCNLVRKNTKICTHRVSSRTDRRI